MLKGRDLSHYINTGELPRMGNRTYLTQNGHDAPVHKVTEIPSKLEAVLIEQTNVNVAPAQALITSKGISYSAKNASWPGLDLTWDEIDQARAKIG
jgi:hypothetical protein